MMQHHHICFRRCKKKGECEGERERVKQISVLTYGYVCRQGTQYTRTRWGVHCVLFFCRFLRLYWSEGLLLFLLLFTHVIRIHTKYRRYHSALRRALSFSVKISRKRSLIFSVYVCVKSALVYIFFPSFRSTRFARGWAHSILYTLVRSLFLWWATHTH